MFNTLKKLTTGVAFIGAALSFSTFAEAVSLDEYTFVVSGKGSPPQCIILKYI